MKNKKMKNLPIINEDHICPICGRKVEKYKKVTVHQNSMDCELTALYCEKCNLPYADHRVSKEYQKTTKHWLRKFKVEEKETRESVFKKLFCTLPVVFPEFQYTYEGSIFKIPIKMYTMTNEQEKCPHCGEKLQKYFTLIPVTQRLRIKVPGKYCPKCGCLYVKNSEEVRDILRDNVHAPDYSIDEEYLWNYTEKLKRMKARERAKKREIELRRERYYKTEEMNKIASALFMIRMSEAGTKQDYIIVTEKQDENVSEKILMYTSEKALKLYTRAFPMEKNEVKKRPGSCEVLYRQYDETEKNKIFPEELYLKSGAGFRSYKGNYRNYEERQVLLYSPYRKEYILRRVGYNKIEKCYILDCILFRDFVKNYGNPLIKVSFFSQLVDYGEEIQSVSELREYGYNVSKQDDLSEKKRQELLAEILDLEILDKTKIINLLEYLIRRNTSERYNNAKIKWSRDLEFVTSYEINPSRFLTKKH